MFENFVPIANPDNRHKFIEYDEEDDLIIGANCSHVFVLPVNKTTYIQDLSVFYKQGLSIILEKQMNDCEVVSLEDGCTQVTVKLSADETLMFQDNSLNVTVQLKLFSKPNGDISYTKPRRLKVKCPIDQ